MGFIEAYLESKLVLFPAELAEHNLRPCGYRFVVESNQEG